VIPPSLRSKDWKSRYRTGQEDVIADFYIPAYEVAHTYSRAVGYFTSSSLALVERGLLTFTSRGGTVRLIASPQLETEDIEDIENGYRVRDVFERATMRALEEEVRPELLDCLGSLGRLVADGLLDIKLAFVEGSHGFGIYHEKIGYFRDKQGDVVAFTGSSNETYGGLVANFESLHVFRSWIPSDSERAFDITSDFETLWSDLTPGLSVEAFPSVARDKLIELARTRPPPGPSVTDDSLLEDRELANKGGQLEIPTGLEARPYQVDAIRAWSDAGGRGVFKMATGTGKTKTALLAASQLRRREAENGRALVVIIVAPQKHLVDQWADEVRLFGEAPIRVYESAKKWRREADEAVEGIRLGVRPGAVFVSTNKSFAGPSFQSLLERITCPVMIIVDEVHNLGSERAAAALPERATYRLGLSATPERHMDEVGTQRIFDYFGDIVFELSMADAIKLGALCRYTYYPRLVELDEQEMEAYVGLSHKIGALLGASDSVDAVEEDSPLGFLLRQRAAILGHASRKLAFLESDVRRHTSSWFQLVYCAEGDRLADLQDHERNPNQLEEVIDLLGNKLGLPVHSYVNETTRAQRRSLLERFASGKDLQFLVAMRCLDEGVDIPMAQIAYVLASSSNPRQFVQRRGRLLRRVDGIDKVAMIYDYLAIPALDGEQSVSETERALVRRELARATEFAELALNYAECVEALRPLRKRYGLMDV